MLTVTANSASRVYGAANPTFGYHDHSGYVNGDTSSVVGGSAAETTSATGSSAPGSYSITFSSEALTASQLQLQLREWDTDRDPSVTDNQLYGSRKPSDLRGFTNLFECDCQLRAGGDLRCLVGSLHGFGQHIDGDRRGHLRGGRKSGRVTPTIRLRLRSTQSVTVNQAALTVTANSASRAYGAANPSVQLHGHRLCER